MKLTVLTSTYKLFMKEQQIEALTKQTFKDFEWVIVDDSYEQNKGFTCSFPVIHMPPNEIVPYFALASCFNDGLVRASGKYVFFMNDYIIPSPTCLARHWEVQEKMGGCILSGRTLAVDGMPATVDGKLTMLKDYRMSIFDTETIKSKDAGDGLREVGRDGIQCWWSGRNDSAPLQAMLDCNGFEEAFDGRWGGQDADMSQRLMTYGLKYYVDTKSFCTEYEHQRGNKKAVRDESQQQGLQNLIINPMVKRKEYIANNQWLIMLPRNIKEEREQQGKLP